MIGNTRHFDWPFSLLDVVRSGKTQGSVTNFGTERTDSETRALAIGSRFFILETTQNKPEIIDVSLADWYS